VFVLTAATPLTAVSAQEIPREKALYMYLGPVLAPEVWNPYLRVDMHYSGLHQFENLFYRNVVRGDVYAWQAEGFTYGKDYTTMTLNLRKGVKWNDGKPFTADDVVFTYNMLIEHAPLLQFSAWVKDTVTSVIKVDDHTVVFQFNGSQPRAHLQMFYANWPIRIVPKHIWEGEDPVTFKNYPNPVWTGAYKLVKADPTSIVLRRDDNWWGKDVFGFLPQVEYLVYVIGPTMAEDQAIASAIANEFDYYGLSWSAYQHAKAKNPDLEFWAAIDPCVKALYVNTKVYPFDRPEVRWALSYAINRTKINMAVYEGISWPARAPLPDYRALDRFLSEDVLAKYNYTVFDPEKGKQILEGLGWTKGTDGVWLTENGTRLGPYVFHTVGGLGDLWGVTITDDLKAFGLDVTYRKLASMTFFEYALKGDYTLSYGNTCGLGIANAFDPWAFFIAFHSKYSNVPIGVPTGLGTDVIVAGTRWNTPEFDAILDALTALNPDDPASLPVYKEALEYWMKNLPIIPFNQPVMGMVRNEHYWVNWPTPENPYMHSFTHHTTFYYQLVNLKPAGAPPITMKTIYATQVLERFLGADMRMYGPFASGDQGSVPSQDADRLVAAGLASWTKPLEPEVAALTAEVTTLRATIADLQTTLTNLRDQLTALQTKTTSLEGSLGSATATSYAAIGVAVIAVVVAAALLFRKPKPT